MKNKSDYFPIIGLEVHVELKTKSKMFCACSADYFGQSPNTHTCPICLGLPGALPVPNRQAIDWCVMIALALNCKINNFSKFDRKNYFYPDLPKGFQTSQYDLPFGEKGWIKLNNGTQIGITRVHMEEDTGKLIHEEIHGESMSLIDYNRSSVPLVEIVTQPDFHSAQDVVEYLKTLQTTIRYLNVSNADMEKGNMRLEPNISLQIVGKKGLPNYKVEVKNINSFRFVEKSIQFEINRQKEILLDGKTPTQETRGWNEFKNATLSQRIKEEANDYRYFPEPDIPPITLSEEEINKLKSLLPELQPQRIERFINEYSLSAYDSEILTREKEMADYFVEAVNVSNKLKMKKEKFVEAKSIANWIINKKVDHKLVLPAKLISEILEGSKTEEIDEATLQSIVDEVLTLNTKAVEDFRAGKETVVMFLVGQVMRKIGKKIDANLVKKKILSTIAS